MAEMGRKAASCDSRTVLNIVGSFTKSQPFIPIMYSMYDIKLCRRRIQADSGRCMAAGSAASSTSRLFLMNLRWGVRWGVGACICM